MENRGNQKHIGIFGQSNVGKSTLFNLLLDQDYSIVSQERGTTTDPVYKTMEVPGLGPCLFIDTAGLFDQTNLEKDRMKRSLKVIEECDLCLVVVQEGMISWDFIEDLHRKKKKVLLVQNGPLSKESKAQIKEDLLPFNKDLILKKLADELGDVKEVGLLDGLVKKGDRLLLVMPQDIQAPKGRLILPQVMTLRACLDMGCLALCCKPENLDQVLKDDGKDLDLVITDSQIFKEVKKALPQGLSLTSFSVLMARYKGDIKSYVAGAHKLDQLDENAKILISEACTHAPMEEDIGRVKIPRLLRKKLGQKIKIDFVRGLDFPDNVKDYDLVISCGSCMFNRQRTLARIDQVKAQGVAISNYGIIIAKLKGILEEIRY